MAKAATIVEAKPDPTPAPAPVADVVPLETRGQRTLMDGGDRFHEAAIHHHRYSVHPEEGTRWETILSDTYWLHIAKKIDAGDIIEVRPEEGHYYAELYVQMKVGSRVQVHCIRKEELPRVDRANGADAFRVEHKGTHRQWCVIRVKDNTIIDEGFKTQGEAAMALPRSAPAR